MVIAIVLLANAAIGFVQENRAERSLEALRDMLVPTARVRGDPAEQLRLGPQHADVGQAVPA